jgi:hypothetical protein
MLFTGGGISAADWPGSKTFNRKEREERAKDAKKYPWRNS